MDKGIKENMEKNGDMVAGWCRCCGNQVIIRAFGLKTQTEYDDEATRQCNCDGAEEIRNKEEQKALAMKKLNSITKDERQQTITLLTYAVDMAADRRIKELNVKINDTTKFKVSISSKGKIKITKEVKETETEEA